MNLNSSNMTGLANASQPLLSCMAHVSTKPPKSFWPATPHNETTRRWKFVSAEDILSRPRLPFSCHHRSSSHDSTLWTTSPSSSICNARTISTRHHWSAIPVSKPNCKLLVITAGLHHHMLALCDLELLDKDATPFWSPRIRRALQRTRAKLPSNVWV